VTAKSLNCFTSLSIEKQESLFEQTHEENAMPDFIDFNQEDKEKTRRRRGCGHPYRMRLNMADDDHKAVATNNTNKAKQQSDGQFSHSSDTHQANNEVHKFARERQGRHPYRRASRLDHSHTKSNQYKDHEHSKHNPHSDEIDDSSIPKLSEESQKTSSFVGHELAGHFHHEGGHSNQKHRSKNLFPYHQRARKKQHDDNQPFQHNHQERRANVDNRYDDNFGNRQSHPKASPSKKSRSIYGNRAHRETFGESTSYNQHLSDRSMPSQQPLHPSVKENTAPTEGAKVFYKKRRHKVSSPSDDR